MSDVYTKTFNARGHLYNEAGSDCPGAREKERMALIDRLEVRAGMRIVDVPAGGGYLADGIYRRWAENVQMICIEPAARFAAAINPVFEIHHDPMTHLSLANGSVDAVGSLAGLHHVADRRPVFAEWQRVLRPAGRVAVADVMAGTGPASFLNEFVHTHTPGGHEGMFFQPGDFTSVFAETGFADASEALVEVPWCFLDVPAMVRFCKTLFATSEATGGQVLEGIETHLGWKDSPAGVEMNWCLLYASAIHP